MRGAHTLFQEIFVVNEVTQERTRKGRSEELHARRNQLLVERYWYYGQYTPARFELIIKILSQEFFLSTSRIPDIIQQHLDSLRGLKSNPLSLRDLKARWPHFVWNASIPELFQDPE